MATVDSRRGSESKSDHDLLIRLDTLVGEVIRNQTNHLEHHRKRDLTMLAVMLGSILTSMLSVGTAIITIIIKLS